MSAKNVRVLVVTPLGQGGQGGIDRMMDALRPRVADFADMGVDMRFQASRGSGSIALAPLYTAGVIARVAGARLGLGPDVAHINLSSHGSTLRKLAISGTARRVGAPYVLHLHGSGFRAYWDKADPRLGDRIRHMFERAARVIVLGSVWRDYIRERAPATADRIEILPNAAPTPPPSPPRVPGSPVHILFLGQIGPRKGAPELLKALASLSDAPGWKATIAGNGEVEWARAEIERTGIASRASAPGWVDPAAVRELLADCDIVVLPSHEENLPMSVIEGMAYGRAVVATPVGAVEDIIEDGETGLLTPVADVAALTAALRRLISDPELRRHLGAAAAASHQRRLNIDVYVERLAEVWRRAARERA